MLNQEIKNMLLADIYEAKYLFNDIPVKVVEHNDEIFVLTNSYDLSDNQDFQLLIYNFKQKYISKGVFDIFWGIDTSFTADELDLLVEPIQFKEVIFYDLPKLSTSWNINANLSIKLPELSNIELYNSSFPVFLAETSINSSFSKSNVYLSIHYTDKNCYDVDNPFSLAA